MLASYSSHVRCARCRRLVARENTERYGGLLYGSCCVKRALASEGWPCRSCGDLYPEQDMEWEGLCRFCAG